MKRRNLFRRAAAWLGLGAVVKAAPAAAEASLVTVSDGDAFVSEVVAAMAKYRKEMEGREFGFIRYGIPFVFGVVPVKPLRGFPPGFTWLEMSPENFARVHVDEGDGFFREYLVREKGGHWVPGGEVGVTVFVSASRGVRVSPEKRLMIGHKKHPQN